MKTLRQTGSNRWQEPARITLKTKQENQTYAGRHARKRKAGKLGFRLQRVKVSLKKLLWLLCFSRLNACASQMTVAQALSVGLSL